MNPFLFPIILLAASLDYPGPITKPTNRLAESPNIESQTDLTRQVESNEQLPYMLVRRDSHLKSTGRIYRDRVKAHWIEDLPRFWYRLDLPGGEREFWLVNADRATRQPAFDHGRMARALSELTGADVHPQKLPFETLRFTENPLILKVTGPDQSWECNLRDYTLVPRASAPEMGDSRTSEPRSTNGNESRGSTEKGVRSPDGRWLAYVREHNLFIQNSKSGETFPLTYDANPNHTYLRDTSWRRLVGMDYDYPAAEPWMPEVYWSPNSRYLVALRTTPGTQRTVYLIDSAPDDGVQPKQLSYPYLKPGDAIPISKPHLFDISERREIPISDTLFNSPWRIDEVRWHPNSGQFTFRYNQRGHQVLRILGVQSPSGLVHCLIEERSTTFIDYAYKNYHEYLDRTGEMIWMSERDGWNHLYLHDLRTGQLKSQITNGPWVVRGVDHVDAESRQIWFRAGGYFAEQDPYYIHYGRVNFDGTGLTFLTGQDATHRVEYSPNRSYLIDTYSRVDQPPITVLRSGVDGDMIMELERADITELEQANWRAPEPFAAKGRDGTTDIYGVIFRPRRFDPNRKYPIIEKIYAGPHGAFVPKSFRASSDAQEMADLGFIVVQIDGMGTSHRSKAFHDICWKNIGDAGFPDRKAWIKAAAVKYPYLDLSRVGIYGGSAGGQNALRALLAHGDFYHVAVADCGCHDNRMDKIWWNELWMGWPVGAHYEEQSNVTQAHRLRGKLMLILGELDKNVDPASTLQVVDALVKADKDFDFVLIPGAGHGAAGTRYGKRRLQAFFQDHLNPYP